MAIEHHRKTPWEIAENWYGVDDIHNCLKNPRTANSMPPQDTTSREFAAWMTHQYRLAMAKGVQLGRDRSED